MKIPLRVTITPTGKPAVYESLDRAEEFIRRLLASETATELALECKVELLGYTPAHQSKLYRAMGFSHVSDATHTFSCWEQEEGRKARKLGDFTALAGRNGAAEQIATVRRTAGLSLWRARIRV